MMIQSKTATTKTTTIMAVLFFCLGREVGVTEDRVGDGEEVGVAEAEAEGVAEAGAEGVAEAEGSTVVTAGAVVRGPPECITGV
jgi:hypothetical protein